MGAYRASRRPRGSRALAEVDLDPHQPPAEQEVGRNGTAMEPGAQPAEPTGTAPLASGVRVCAAEPPEGGAVPDASTGALATGGGRDEADVMAVVEADGAGQGRPETPGGRDDAVGPPQSGTHDGVRCAEPDPSDASAGRDSGLGRDREGGCGKRHERRERADELPGRRRPWSAAHAAFLRGDDHGCHEVGSGRPSATGQPLGGNRTAPPSFRMMS